jgi:hypothetical protein
MNGGAVLCDSLKMLENDDVLLGFGAVETRK